MKKPLHQKESRFLITSKGRTIAWGRADVKNLVKKANRARSEDLFSKEDVTGFEYECLLSFQWFELLLKKKCSNEFVRKLNSRIQHVRYHHILRHSKNGLPYWDHIANGDAIMHPEVAVAYGIGQLLATGALTGLKSCSLTTCQNFFIGRPNAKWCSNKCGSRYRVTRKRQRDRN